MSEQAPKIDPDNALALNLVALTYFTERLNGWGNSETEYDEEILGRVERAIALAPDYVVGYSMKSYYLGFSRRFSEAVRAADAGLAIDPNYASLYSARGTAEISLGRFEQAKSDFQQAMRLSPRDPALGIWHQQLGDIEIGAGHIKASIEEYQKAFDLGVRHFWIYANLAAAYALEGRMDEAKANLTEARRLNPSYTVKWDSEHAEDIPTRREGLRKAGLPEE